MIGCGGFAALMSISLFCAQQTELPVVNAALLESEAPLLIFLLGIVFLRNKPISLQFFGLLFGFIGSLFCSQGC